MRRKCTGITRIRLQPGELTALMPVPQIPNAMQGNAIQAIALHRIEMVIPRYNRTGSYRTSNATSKTLEVTTI
jgi:hypothetical protein